jgi:branched-chain amino acid transport system permease protein
MRSFWQNGIKKGLIGGVTAVLLCLIGMIETFAQRDIIHEIISMGQTLLLLVGILIGYLAAKKSPLKILSLLNSAVSGLLAGGCLLTLVLLGKVINLRAMFINASPFLYNLITLGHDLETGGALLLGIGILSGLFGCLLFLIPSWIRKMTVVSLGCVVVSGVLQDLIRPTLSAWGSLSVLTDRLFSANGLSVSGAAILFAALGVIIAFWTFQGRAIKNSYGNLPPNSQRSLRYAGILLLMVILLLLPWMLGLFLSEVLTIVGLHVLLGLGLNIVVGYAGLLDLGYVAFFAIGAYVTAILTSPELGFFNLSFWAALPFAIILGIISGVLLGIPVLKMRGDYLAITTLGFGEIIRILVLSDFLKPWLGGAQGIGKIPKPAISGMELAAPQQLYYLIFAGCLLVVFISLRLRGSRLGRAWMAIREDEDVAQAMGINLVATKLLAFATGAGFSALSGAIFAAKLSSVYPHSFNVMISINILCLIIVGGMGSIPGVIIGAAALVGLPELLREFAEYRLLVYGAALVAMMVLRPEGLWPEAVHRRELHEYEDTTTGEEAAAAHERSL